MTIPGDVKKVPGFFFGPIPIPVDNFCTREEFFTLCHLCLSHSSEPQHQNDLRTQLQFTSPSKEQKHLRWSQFGPQFPQGLLHPALFQALPLRRARQPQGLEALLVVLFPSLLKLLHRVVVLEGLAAQNWAEKTENLQSIIPWLTTPELACCNTLN